MTHPFVWLNCGPLSLVEAHSSLVSPIRISDESRSVCLGDMVPESFEKVPAGTISGFTQFTPTLIFRDWHIHAYSILTRSTSTIHPYPYLPSCAVSCQRCSATLSEHPGGFQPCSSPKLHPGLQIPNFIPQKTVRPRGPAVFGGDHPWTGRVQRLFRRGRPRERL